MLNRRVPKLFVNTIGFSVLNKSTGVTEEQLDLLSSSVVSEEKKSFSEILSEFFPNISTDTIYFLLNKRAPVKQIDLYYSLLAKFILDLDLGRKTGSKG